MPQRLQHSRNPDMHRDRGRAPSAPIPFIEFRELGQRPGDPRRMQKIKILRAPRRVFIFFYFFFFLFSARHGHQTIKPMMIDGKRYYQIGFQIHRAPGNHETKEDARTMAIFLRRRSISERIHNDLRDL